MARRKGSSAADIEHARTVARCCELRIQGRTLQEIGDEVGWHKSTVSRAISKAMADVVTEPAAVVVKQELDRLDIMFQGLWLAGATTGDPKAVMAVLAVMKRRAELLGLDDFERRMIELAERKQSLDEAQGALVVALMDRVFDRLDLTAEQRALLPVVVPGEIARLEIDAAPRDD